MQLHNLAKSRTWKNKYTNQYFKLIVPITTYFGKCPHMATPLKQKKTPSLLKSFLKTKKSPPRIVSVSF